MAYATPDFNSIRDAILRDILNEQRKNGKEPNVSKDGDYYLRANATGSAIEGLYQHQQWICRQIFPDQADDDTVEHHASLRNLTRKVATKASGSIAFSGTPGSASVVGVESKSAGGIAFLTTEAGLIGGGGTANIAAQASVAGLAGNQDAGTALTLTAAPDGFLSAASIVSMTGGTDIETIPSLLSRLLFLLRNPPCGGALHDYYTWAMNVAGVTRAYPYSNRRANGTVDVVILTSGGLPGGSLIASAQDYIDSQRPATANALVLTATEVAVNVAAALVIAAGYLEADVIAAIEAKLAVYFNTMKPGDTAFLHKIRAIISDTPGVVDFNLTSPVANVITRVDATHVEMPVLGTRVWS